MFHIRSALRPFSSPLRSSTPYSHAALFMADYPALSVYNSAFPSTDRPLRTHHSRITTCTTAGQEDVNSPKKPLLVQWGCNGSEDDSTHNKEKQKQNRALPFYIYQPPSLTDVAVTCLKMRKRDDSNKCNYFLV